MALSFFQKLSRAITGKSRVDDDTLDAIEEALIESDMGVDTTLKVIDALEYNRYYRVKTLGEPQLGRRGLVPTMSSKETYQETLALKDILAYADGRNDLIEISNIIEQPVSLVTSVINKLQNAGLVKEIRREPDIQ